MAQRVVVVGAGIVGVSSAFSLRRDGHAVTLIDRAEPGEGASFGNASIIAMWAVAPVQTPGIVWKVPGMLLDPLGPLAIRWRYLPRLAPWLCRFVAASGRRRVEEIASALAALLAGAVEAFDPLLRAAQAPDLIRRAGAIGLYETEADFRGSAPLLELERRLGVRQETLDADAVRQMAPALAPAFARGVFYPEVAHAADPHLLVKRLAEAFVRGGGRLVREEAVGFEIGGGAVRAVRTRAAVHPCDAAIVAAGAWSKPLAAALGHRPPLDTERGYHVQLPAPGVELRLPVYVPDRGIAMTPLTGGLRLAGTVELGGLAAPPDWRRAQALLARARGWLPGLKEEGATRWMGFRPSMPDSLPVISGSPRLRNAFFAFGHGHLGLTLGARTGAIVAALVGGRDPGLDVAPYRIDRF
jgi:D-amino-acid dehydrogenase